MSIAERFFNSRRRAVFLGVRMPEKQFASHLAGWWDTIFQALAFSVIGMLIAIGQMLQAKEPITLKIALGRCITTGGLALVAGSVLALFPGLPFIAQLGIAAMLASLGNSGLELLIQRLFNR